MTQPVPLDFAPGISRDGTDFDSNNYTDALWTRWRLGRPRKIPGYRRMTDTLTGIPRRMHAFFQSGQIVMHIGTTQGIQQVITDINGNVLSVIDRTPVVGFTPGTNVGWTLDAIFDTTSAVVQLVAHSVPDVGFSASTVQTVPFIGIINDPTPLVQFSDPTPSSGTWVQPNIAGGIVCVQPYVFDFDVNGLVQWSAPNLPLYLGVTGGSTGAGQARISAQKLYAGMPLRGGGVQQPAVLFWSATEVISGVFVGSSSGGFAFSTISPSSSILSTDVVVEYDGLYFWAGTDRFLVFNGTVSEVPNKQNQDWFFDNINWNAAAKSYAFKIPRYGEIWFCAPLFGATECSHAVIYNVRENSWYDTVLPNGGRSAGLFVQGLRYPVMGGLIEGDAGYKLWLHETGTDEIDGNAVSPIRSYYETGYIGGPKNTPPSDEGLSVQQFEPDFIQTGDMSIYVLGQPNVRGPIIQDNPVPLKLIPGVPQEQFVSFKTSHRLIRLHVESNTLGGSYVTGRCLLHADRALDARLFS